MKIISSKNYNHSTSTIQSLREPDKNDKLESGSLWIHTHHEKKYPMSIFFTIGNGEWYRYMIDDFFIKMKENDVIYGCDYCNKEMNMKEGPSFMICYNCFKFSSHHNK